MVRVISFDHKVIHEAGWSTMLLALSLFVSISALVALCAKRTGRSKLTTETRSEDVLKSSSMASPRRILASISNRASNMSFMKKKSDQGSSEELSDEGFGEGGLWQNTILMGEKCQPFKFPDAIFYDSYGNRVSEMPKSPRASPMSTFSFPVMRETPWPDLASS